VIPYPLLQRVHFLLGAEGVVQVPDAGEAAGGDVPGEGPLFAFRLAAPTVSSRALRRGGVTPGEGGVAPLGADSRGPEGVGGVSGKR
jgi:hypothetical protein